MNINIEQIIQYWKSHAEYDMETAEAMFDSKRYPYCLFFCHLALEKILKALVVRQTKKHAPYIHDLVTLAGLAGISVTAEQLNNLQEINTFNLEARYDDFKQSFYQKSTKERAEKYLKISKDLYLWLNK